ncbi:MAG: DNA repair protein RadC [Bacteroidales bacterium]|nr:DNA repair protein RadC [Bacteroidales bacterium]MBR7027683.1 DNA repair protein RadC [Bacteroidales bacterium]
MKAIKQWQAEERPREKMATRGAEALTNAELLAIILHTGDSGHTAVDLARELIDLAGGSLKALSALTPDRMSSLKGIGPAKAVTIAAAVELGKRIALDSCEELPPIYSSRAVADMMRPQIGNLLHEECWVLYLNRANRLIGKERISYGGVSSTVMDIKIIAKKAVEKLAGSIILLHNHPSGNVTPSSEDKRQTLALRKAVSLFDIDLMDHIIIGNSRYFSFCDAGI